MKFAEHIRLDEMLVHNLSRQPESVIAFRGHIWLVDRYTPELQVREIERTIRSEHPQSDRMSQRQIDDVGDLTDWLYDSVTDALVAHWNPRRRTLHTTYEFGTNPVTAPLVRRVAETLKATKVSYDNEQFINGDHVERQVQYKRPQLLGRLPDEMFHGTTTKYLPSILRFGLRPDMSGSNWAKQNIYHDDRVFLAARFEDSEFHAARTARAKGGHPVVLKIAVPDKAKLAPDWDADITATNHDYFHGGDSVPSYSSVDSMKSSRNAGLIAYVGRIPATFVTAVHLFAGGKWRPVRLDTLKKRVEEDPWEWGYKYGLGD